MGKIQCATCSKLNSHDCVSLSKLLNANRHIKCADYTGITVDHLLTSSVPIQFYCKELLDENFVEMLLDGDLSFDFKVIEEDIIISFARELIKRKDLIKTTIRKGSRDHTIELRVEARIIPPSQDKIEILK